MRARIVTPILLVLLPAVQTAAAPAPEPGEALYRTARQLLAEGKTEQALKKLEAAVAASPQGPFADDALLAAAEIDYGASSLAELGRSDPVKLARARPRLEMISRNYRGSDSGPQATLRLGLLEMDPSNPNADLDEAFATFLQTVRLYPGSPEAAEALYAAGACHRQMGQVAASAGEDAQIVFEHAASPPVPRAKLRLAESAAVLGENALARALAGELVSPPDDAPSEARASDPVVRSVPVPLSLRRLAASFEALLLREEADRAAGTGTRTFDRTFPESGESRAAAALATDAEGRIHRLESGTGRVALLETAYEPKDPPIQPSSAPRPAAERDLPASRANPASPAGGDDQASQASTAMEDARGLAVGPDGEIYLWDERGIVLPSGRRIEPKAVPDKGGEPEPLKRIAGLAPGPFGDFDVLDASSERLLHYGPDFSFRSVIARFDTKPTALARWDGTLLVLLASRREIAIVSREPRATVTTLGLRGEGWELRSPAAVATDALGRIYVLDDSARSVTVLDRSGARVGLLAPEKGSIGEFRSPTSIAVDRAGRIYVADKKLGRVLRFQ